MSSSRLDQPQSGTAGHQAEPAGLSVTPRIRDAANRLMAGCTDVVTESDLVQKLVQAEAEHRPLRAKLGIDASGPEIHLGFAVVLEKLRQFQELGHTAVLIVGDFTGMIGDPSGRSKTRPQLSETEIQENMARYQEQVYKILIPEQTEFCYNSTWSDPLTARELIALAAKLTLARIIEREDFKNRLAQGQPLGLHEVLYPLFQAYDSVAVKADVELGGQDQFWNLLVGRDLQRELGQSPQVVMTVPLLLGTDGKAKMSKSYGNYVGIAEPPDEIFGKLMSLPDAMITRYLELAAFWPSERVREAEERMEQGENPRDWKERLAREVVARYYSAATAEQAATRFRQVFSAHQVPEDMAEYRVAGEEPLVEIIVRAGLLKTRSEARRKILEGAVDLDGQPVKDLHLRLRPTRPHVLKVGKRKFCRLVPGGGADDA